MDQSYRDWMDRAAVDARVRSIDQAELGYDDCEARYTLRGQPFTGFSATRFADGGLSSLTGFTEGIEHGVSVAWYPDGRIEGYAETSGSVYHGVVAMWSEDGALVRVSRYDRGLEIGASRREREP